MRVVVCGAGVIGASVAYFLAERGIGATVVERGEVACAATGKAGGFLALDWSDGSPLGPLARASFSLHAELADRLAREQGDYGYRAVDTLLVRERDGSGQADHWLDGAAQIRGLIGDVRTTAQVHPAQFTRALLDGALARGAVLRYGEVKGLAATGSDSRTRVHGVLVDDETLEADVVVLAMGPWTGALSGPLPLPPVIGLRGNSVILRPQHDVPAECLFVETNDPQAGNISPEIYPRPDGEVYVCGMADDLPFPADPLSIEPHAPACDVLIGVASRLSGALAKAEVVQRQACFRPITHDGLPLLGPVPGMNGVYVATAHNCWGILNAPASGQALAELISTGTTNSIDLAPFDPGRFTAPGEARAPFYHRA